MDTDSVGGLMVNNLYALRLLTLLVTLLVMKNRFATRSFLHYENNILILHTDEHEESKTNIT